MKLIEKRGAGRGYLEIIRKFKKTKTIDKKLENLRKMREIKRFRDWEKIR